MKHCNHTLGTLPPPGQSVKEQVWCEQKRSGILLDLTFRIGPSMANHNYADEFGKLFLMLSHLFHLLRDDRDTHPTG